MQTAVSTDRYSTGGAKCSLRPQAKTAPTRPAMPTREHARKSQEHVHEQSPSLEQAGGYALDAERRTSAGGPSAFDKRVCTICGDRSPGTKAASGPTHRLRNPRGCRKRKGCSRKNSRAPCVGRTSSAWPAAGSCSVSHTSRATFSAAGRVRAPKQPGKTAGCERGAL